MKPEKKATTVLKPSPRRRLECNNMQKIDRRLITSMNCIELRRHLNRANLPTDGDKGELEARLQQVCLMDKKR